VGYYIKVKDAKGVIRIAETVANTAGKTSTQLLQEAAAILSIAVSTLTLLSHGKKEQK
jgi:hypothetical protein